MSNMHYFTNKFFGQCFENFLEKLFCEPSCFVKVIRRFGFGPIYTNLIVTIVVGLLTIV